jgi:predicted RNase H-like HicB family nuclease
MLKIGREKFRKDLKIFEYYFIMSNFNIIIEKGEDGYLISEVVELPGCHTQAKDMNELLIRTKEAINLYLEEQGDIIISDNFIGVQKIEVHDETTPINC